jgi:hypothetical protein
MFTAHDASQLSDAWYADMLPGLSAARRDTIKHQALDEFADYRDSFKTFDEWCDCLAEKREAFKTNTQ